MGTIIEAIYAGWKYYSNHTSHYNGRIIVVWRPDLFLMDVVSDTCQIVSCKFTYIPKQLRFFVTFIYGFNLKVDRIELCQYLVQLAQSNPGAWCILGDFNSLLRKEDRIEGTSVNLSEVEDFQQCLDT